MENSFSSLIQSANEISILLSNNPSLDQVASGLSLYLSLVGSGKNVSISCPVAMTAEYSRLIGVDKIAQELGNKNLTIKFINYKAEDIDKVRADVEQGLFTVTVLPKADKKTPTKDQINITYSGTLGDMIILIGGNNDSHFPVISNPDFAKAKMIHLGTKLLEITNNNLQVLSFARPASSISEVTATLLKESSFVIDADIATNLLAGIEEESDNFQKSEVTVSTFEIFAELLKMGGLRTQKVSHGTFPQGAIPTKPYNDKQMTVEEAEAEIQQDIPPSWSEPKIYTGNSLS